MKLEKQEENQDKDNPKVQNIEPEAEPENRGTNDSIAKVTISKRAESLMSDLVAKVNEGFEFGRVSRHQLISWILAKFSDEVSESDIRNIRQDHFDELALLEMSLKRFKQAGGLPPELKKMLLAQAGWEDAAKKSSKKAG